MLIPHPMAVELALGKHQMEREGVFLPAEDRKDSATTNERGHYLLLQILDSGPLPSSSAIWKELYQKLRQVVGHNNRKSIASYWKTPDGTPWPKEPLFTLREAQLWPRFKQIQETQQPGQGKSLVTVCGINYSMRGGYGRGNLSPKLNTKLAQVLVEAANHSLATSTWSNYQSVWKRLTYITWETGIAFHYPMTGLMCPTIVGWFLSRGRRAATILSYMAAVRQAHVIRGLEAQKGP